MNETKKNGVPIITVSVEMALQFGYWSVKDSEGRVYVGKDYLTQSAAEQGLLLALRKIYYMAATTETL